MRAPTAAWFAAGPSCRPELRLAAAVGVWKGDSLGVARCVRIYELSATFPPDAVIPDSPGDFPNSGIFASVSPVKSVTGNGGCAIWAG